MKNEQLVRRAIATIAENSESYICTIVSDGELVVELRGTDPNIMKMIEVTTARYIADVAGDGDNIADAIDDLLDDLGLGGETCEP